MQKEMSSNVDKFFKDKLGNHAIPPAPQSWEKVEARLSKKNSLSLVYRVAAAVVLVGVFVMLILSQTDNPPLSPTLTKKDLKSAPPLTSTPKTEQLKDDNKVLRVQHDRTKTVAKLSGKKIQTPEATPTTEQVVLVPEQHLTAEVAQPEVAKAKRMVLVYSLPTIGKKAEADAVAVAPSDEEKRTGLQKVMDVALEVKSGDSPLGELREAKDELFALEFRKDKNKGKNH